VFPLFRHLIRKRLWTEEARIKTQPGIGRSWKALEIALLASEWKRVCYNFMVIRKRLWTEEAHIKTQPGRTSPKGVRSIISVFEDDLGFIVRVSFWSVQRSEGYLNVSKWNERAPLVPNHPKKIILLFFTIVLVYSPPN